ncbi:MAG: LysR family transcriptional regulator [Desulfobacterales bacterium]|nr:LysR family transcriptional regulator [Desulfobacterales bacterium]
MKHSPRKSSINFNLRQLEIFCKVVEHKSFSKAASAVFLAQASVSERILNLEEMIGAKLLDRLGREVVPTKAGKLLHAHARILLDMRRTACLAMENFIGIKQGKIHIGGSTIPGEYILPKYIEQFNKQFPDISVILTIADTCKIEEDIAGGYLELGIVGSKNTKKTLTYYELWDDELVVAIPAEHSLAKKQRITVEELFQEPFILREKGSGTLKIMENYLQKHESASIESLNIVARLGSSTAVKEGIKAGLGISILSSRALETEIKTGILKALKIKGFDMKRKFYLMKDKKRTASPLCQAIFDFLIATSTKKL